MEAHSMRFKVHAAWQLRTLLTILGTLSLLPTAKPAFDDILHPDFNFGYKCKEQ